MNRHFRSFDNVEFDQIVIDKLGFDKFEFDKIGLHTDTIGLVRHLSLHKRKSKFA